MQNLIPESLHLQKEMYLLQNVFPELADEADYKPYFLGPYSEIVTDEVEQLVSSDMINVENGRIKLAPDGHEIVNKLKKS